MIGKLPIYYQFSRKESYRQSELSSSFVNVRSMQNNGVDYQGEVDEVSGVK